MMACALGDSRCAAWSEQDDAETELRQLTAEAAERMRIVEDLANATPWASGGETCGWCLFCDRRLEHADGCLWVRARKAVQR